jgi:2',3'-cyclic-nucleotide 2'-phosphodiesterase (5'-nucleotidase family)
VAFTVFRSDIEAGEITGEDVLAVLPFNNTVDRIVMNGTGIRNVLEIPGSFLQVIFIRGKQN